MRRGGGNLLYLLKFNQEQLLECLDSLVDNRSEQLAIKRLRLNTYRENLHKGHTAEEKYTACLYLYEEFSKLKNDSALYYSNLLHNYAQQTKNIHKINTARLARSMMLIYAGMYKAATDLLEHIPANSTQVDLVEYYRTYFQLYHVMAQTSSPGQLKLEYEHIKRLYRDSVLQVVDTGRLTCKLMKHSQRMEENGDPHESIKEMSHALLDKKNNMHDCAVISHSLADAYEQLGNLAETKRFRTLAAIYDLKTPILQYSALPCLAQILFRESDVLRAARYITRSLEDAIECNAVNRVLIASRAMIDINHSFLQEVRKHQIRLQEALGILIAVILLLSAILVIILRQKNTINKLRKQHADDNDRLIELNEQLRQINHQQATINEDLSKANTIKDKYLKHYMQLSTLYIDKLEKYRLKLYKTYNSYGLDRLLRELRSLSLIDNEYKSFFKEFDTVFLSMYPKFIEQANALLQETEQLKTASLNTEFRLLAVIRLGITDNSQIAQFLHISINTVYTYRNRLRNAATGNPTEFEQEIMQIH